MSSALQNRLVGTIIVVALAVIFLPDLLDGEKQTNQDLFESLPEQPKMQAVNNIEDFPEEQVKQDVSRKVEIVPDVATDDFDINENNAGSATNEEQSNSQTTISQQITSAEIDRPIEDSVAVDNNENQNRLPAKAGWVVQLGVFRHQKNVSELLGKLRKAGYQAFSRPVQTSTGELTKVFVGPELNKEKLQQAVPHLRELTKLQGRVTPFTVK